MIVLSVRVIVLIIFRSTLFRPLETSQTFDYRADKVASYMDKKRNTFVLMVPSSLFVMRNSTKETTQKLLYTSSAYLFSGTQASTENILMQDTVPSLPPLGSSTLQKIEPTSSPTLSFADVIAQLQTLMNTGIALNARPYKYLEKLPTA